MKLELRHLRSFVAVAETRSFTRAAERLHLTQPPLSQQIRQLEDIAGARLFERTTRDVRLTAAGEALLPRARALLEEAEQALVHVRAAAQGQQGTLALGYYGSAILGAFVPSLARFRRAHPGVALDLVELSPDEQEAALKAGRIHAGFGRVPPRDPALGSAVVEEGDLLLALPAAHPLAKRRRVPVALLADDTWLLLPRALVPSLHDETVAYWRQVGITPAVQEVGEFAAIPTLVGAGLGVGLVFEAARRLRFEGVLYRPLDVPPPKSRVFMAWAGAAPSARVQRLLDAFRAERAAR